MESKDDDILIKTNIKKIKRQYKENIFSLRMKSNLTKYLLNFLDFKSKLNFAKTSIFITNNFIENENLKTFDIVEELHEKYPLIEMKYDKNYFVSISDNLLKIKDLFKFKDSEKDIAKYESPEMRKNYLKIENKRKSFITLGNCFNWPWKDNKHYWDINKKYNTNYFNYNFWYLYDVCWIHSFLI